MELAPSLISMLQLTWLCRTVEDTTAAKVKSIRCSLTDDDDNEDAVVNGNDGNESVEVPFDVISFI